MAQDFTGGTPFREATEGFAPDTNTGYDVNAIKTRLSGQKEPAQRNGKLHNGSQYVHFFCWFTDMDFSLANKTAQSRYVRDFYAHNIEIPAIMVFCESLDQGEYGNIIEFIHESQRKAVGGKQIMQLAIDSGGRDDVPVNKHGKQIAPPKIRGKHGPILAEGFVETIERVHEHFIYKVDFEFRFIVSRMLDSNVYSESTLGKYPPQKTYAEILAKLTENAPTPPPHIEHKAPPPKTPEMSPNQFAKEVFGGPEEAFGPGPGRF